MQIEASKQITKARAAGIIILLFQCLVCLVYGFKMGYHQDIFTQYSQGDLILVACLFLLALLGFGAMNGYISNASFSGIGSSLLILVITFQHYFMIRCFWYKAGLYAYGSNASDWNSNFNKISFANINQQNIQTSSFLSHASFVDAIVASICMILAYTPLVGRVQFLQILLLTFIGTFLYQINFQIFCRLFINDIGYGMRLFLFSGTLSTFCPLFLIKNGYSASNHIGFYSKYPNKVLTLLGFILAFCLFPFLVAGNLHNTTANNAYGFYIAVLNMYLALGAGVLGCFATAGYLQRKFSVFELIYSGLSGGIGFSSSADLHANPAIPLASGFIFGLVSSYMHARMFRKINKDAVRYSLPVINRLLIPGIFCSVFSAILCAVNEGSTGNYVKKPPNGRTAIQQGGFQIAGMLITICIAFAASLIIGILLFIFNSNQVAYLFNDATLYQDQRKQQDQTIPKGIQDFQ